MAETTTTRLAELLETAEAALREASREAAGTPAAQQIHHAMKDVQAIAAGVDR